MTGHWPYRSGRPRRDNGMAYDITHMIEGILERLRSPARIEHQGKSYAVIQASIAIDLDDKSIAAISPFAIKTKDGSDQIVRIRRYDRPNGPMIDFGCNELERSIADGTLQLTYYEVR